MDYYDFKRVHRNFCKDHGYQFPNSNVSMRKALHKEYEASLMTAPIEDCAETAKEFLMNTPLNQIVEDMKPFPLAPLPKAVPVCKPALSFWGCAIQDCIKEEGKIPMRNYNDAYASASVTSPKSDTAVQRDYLISRLESLQYPKDRELQKVFNLYVNSSPKTYKELIDVIKNGKYTIDSKIAKRIDAAEAEEDDMELNQGPFYGIIWEGPSPDWKGYNAALEDRNKQAAKARDIIMSGVYADGLKALQDFEAWLPTSQSAN